MANRGLLRAAFALGLVLGIGLVLVYRDRFDPAAIQAWLTSAGALGPLLFMALYAVATVLFLPGSVLTLAGGALFGPLWGTLYNLTGATLGALLAFLVARYLAADWVQARLAGRLGRLIRGVEAEGWRFVAFARLVPLFPFNLLNYGLGLTRIPLLQYLIASALCMLPAAFAYTYLGHVGREALAGEAGLVQKGLLALGLLAAVAFLPRLIARLRVGPTMEVETLKRRLETGDDLLLLDVRSPAEFEGEPGHVPGALNLPLKELAARWKELGQDPERPIAVICRSDRRSATAARLLTGRGFGDVQVVRGGMIAWHAQHWPVERNNVLTEGEPR